MPALIDRLTAEDMVSLATDVGPVPMHAGAVLTLRHNAGAGAGDLARTISQRVTTVSRLRQRLLHTAPGAGRPVWVDDARFDARHHVRERTCPPPGDEQALWNLATDVLGEPFVADRPLWRAVVVSGVTIDGTDHEALIVVMHHVLADGIGGLAILANLVDGGPTTNPVGFPRPQPTTRELVIDTVRSRVRAVTNLRAGLQKVAAAAGELREGTGTRAGATSLNRPTSSHRHVGVTRVPLAPVKQIAHRHDATVNDIVLVAVASALVQLLRRRGEHLDDLVVSMPVSARRDTTTAQLGNEVGAIPVHVPIDGDRGQRFRTVAARTREAKRRPRGATSAVLGPVFRLLAHIGLFRWFVEHQHLVHTFVTNLHGPDESLRFLDIEIEEIIALAAVPGNVTASFAVLSYAGTLRITVMVDPEAWPEADDLRAAIQSEFDDLITDLSA